VAEPSAPRIAAVVLAAGLSRRMGRPKLLLPWRNGRTVIEEIVETLRQAGVLPIYVVSGAFDVEIRHLLQHEEEVMIVYNAAFAESEMMDSLRLGIKALHGDGDAALVALGDQPQMRSEVVRELVATYATGRPAVLVPVFHGRRGHPWIVSKELWEDLVTGDYATPRDFLAAHVDQTASLEIESPEILQDLDLPEDYEQMRPE
jgi:molybdenum cofactor cytidylyltransferase